MSRSIVAQFTKDASKHLSLFSVIVLSEKKMKDGSGETYFSRDIYDVDYSKSHGYIYHLSGGGGRGPVEVNGIYFASPGVAIKESPCTLVDSKDEPPWRSAKTKSIRNRNRTRRLRAVPKAFTDPNATDLLDWLELHGIDDKAIWCDICKDCSPSDSLCDHCSWCDRTGGYSTPGEPCGCCGEQVNEFHCR